MAAMLTVPCSRRCTLQIWVTAFSSSMWYMHCARSRRFAASADLSASASVRFAASAALSASASVRFAAAAALAASASHLVASAARLIASASHSAGAAKLEAAGATAASRSFTGLMMVAPGTLTFWVPLAAAPAPGAPLAAACASAAGLDTARSGMPQLACRRALPASGSVAASLNVAADRPACLAAALSALSAGVVAAALLASPACLAAALSASLAGAMGAGACSPSKGSAPSTAKMAASTALAAASAWAAVGKDSSNPVSPFKHGSLRALGAPHPGSEVDRCSSAAAAMLSAALPLMLTAPDALQARSGRSSTPRLLIFRSVCSRLHVRQWPVMWRRQAPAAAMEPLIVHLVKFIAQRLLPRGAWD
eukprot:365916-Chlamydomonas_euryale.AAC.4